MDGSLSKLFHDKKWYTQQNQGMTFIELIVIISLFGIIASVVLFNSRDFSSNISLQNLSQDIALTIKRAQTTSASGGYNTLFVLPNKPSYVCILIQRNNHFIILLTLITVAVLNLLIRQIVICGTPVVGDECIEKYTISGTDDIKEVCANSKLMQADIECSPDKPLEVVFKRPNLDAVIRYAGFPVISTGVIVDGKIVIQSADETRQKILLFGRLVKLA